MGPVQRITAAQDNVVLALDGEPALDVLLRTLDVSLEGDPQIAVERVRATLAGLMDAGEELGTCARTGHFGPDTRACAKSWLMVPATAWHWPNPSSPACGWRFASAVRQLRMLT